MNPTGMGFNPVTGSTYAYDPATLSRRSVVSLVFVSLICSVVSSGTTAGVFVDPTTVRPAQSKTDAGQVDQVEAVHAAALTELRLLTGLTWDQIASLFEVSRRAVHFWANGKPLAAAHQEHLERSLSCMKAADKGNAPVNRQALFAADTSGVAPFDLLVRKQYPEFVTAMGLHCGQKTNIRRNVPVELERRPASPHLMAGAIEESAHRDAGPAKRVKVHKA